MRQSAAIAEEPEEEDEAPKADPFKELRRSVQVQIQSELLKRLDMKRLTLQGAEREQLVGVARQ